MESFKNHKKGTELEFSSYTGEVLDSNKYSETRVYSSGGGGTVNSGSGYVDAPTIHSSSSTVHEFWIKESNGNEKAISISGYDIPLRAGQKITAIYAGEKGSGQYLWTLVNHNAQNHWFLSKKGFEGLNPLTFLGFLKFVTYPVIVFFLSVLLAGILDSATLGVFTFVAGIVYGLRWIAKVIKYDSQFQKDLDEHLEKVIADTYKSN